VLEATCKLLVGYSGCSITCGDGGPREATWDVAADYCDHVVDPVYFYQHIRVTIQQIGYLVDEARPQIRGDQAAPHVSARS